MEVALRMTGTKQTERSSRYPGIISGGSHRSAVGVARHIPTVPIGPRVPPRTQRGPPQPFSCLFNCEQLLVWEAFHFVIAVLIHPAAHLTRQKLICSADLHLIVLIIVEKLFFRFTLSLFLLVFILTLLLCIFLFFLSSRWFIIRLSSEQRLLHPIMSALWVISSAFSLSCSLSLFPLLLSV